MNAVNLDVRDSQSPEKQAPSPKQVSVKKEVTAGASTTLATAVGAATPATSPLTGREVGVQKPNKNAAAIDALLKDRADRTEPPSPDEVAAAVKLMKEGV